MSADNVYDSDLAKLNAVLGRVQSLIGDHLDKIYDLKVVVQADHYLIADIVLDGETESLAVDFTRHGESW